MVYRTKRAREPPVFRKGRPPGDEIMRFLYYDAITHIEKGESITGVKTFSLSEEFFREHYKKRALIPGVIMIEAMAQLLGWLVIYSHDFHLAAIMSLIEGVTVTSNLRPGLKAEIRGELLSSSRRDSLGRAWMTVEGKQVASMDRIIYVHQHRPDERMLRELVSYYGGPTG